MPVFIRGFFTEIWITLRSDESLGILDGDYIEDYFGVDGQVSLVHESGTRYTVLMNEVLEETTTIPHDVFTGFLSLESLPNGHYSIQGRVRDIVNSYTIIGAVEEPFGDERVINLEFDIADGPPSDVSVEMGALKLMGTLSLDISILGPLTIDPSYAPELDMGEMLFGTPDEILIEPQSDVDTLILLQPEVNLGDS